MNLTWHGKDEAVKAARNTPYHLLRERAEFSYPPQGTTATADSSNLNLIIQGDNLAALKSLLPFYAGQVKCIYIDPPYNTGTAFTHYDDNLEHSLWLNLMYPRLELLRELLAEDGSIWITLDDNEIHYCKAICDEVFGRNNFINNIVWQHRKSVQSDVVISLAHNHVLTYAKNKKRLQLNRLKSVDVNKYSNPDNDPRGPWVATPFDAPHIRPNLTYPITNPNTGATYLPPQGRHWRTTQDEYNRLLADNRIVFGKKGESKPQAKLFLSEAQEKGSSVKTWWEDCGTATEGTKELQKIFEVREVFDTPKPERLIQRILQIATNENDLVLDSFLGSGTTAAVAHKMNRRYIGIEIGQHAQSHVVPRLQKVIDGEQGGISTNIFAASEIFELVHDDLKDLNLTIDEIKVFHKVIKSICTNTNLVSADIGKVLTKVSKTRSTQDVQTWQGGGSFRFCELGESVFDAFGSINPSIKFPDLAAHVWYLENRVPFAPQDTPSPLLGLHNGRACYLLYNGILGDKRPQGGNVLTKKVLAELPNLMEFLSQGVEVTIYGEATRLTDLAEQGIAFKQIPYDISAK